MPLGAPGGPGEEVMFEPWAGSAVTRAGFGPLGALACSRIPAASVPKSWLSNASTDMGAPVTARLNGGALFPRQPAGRKPCGRRVRREECGPAIHCGGNRHFSEREQTRPTIG